MKHLHRVIAAYAAMDQRRKEEMLALMESRAEKYPARGKSVGLRLVANNGRANDPRLPSGGA